MVYNERQKLKYAKILLNRENLIPQLLRVLQYTYERMELSDSLQQSRPTAKGYLYKVDSIRLPLPVWTNQSKGLMTRN